MADSSKSAVTGPAGQPTTGVPSDAKLQLVDLGEVRRRIAEKREPTVRDVLALMEVERHHSDQLDLTIGQMQRDQASRDRDFKGEVLNAVEGHFRLSKNGLRLKRLTWAIGGLAVLFLIGFIVALSAAIDAQSAQETAEATKNAIGEKADRLELAKFKEGTEANFAKMQTEIKVIATKADQSVVDRLAAELRARDGQQEARISDISTLLMAKADKERVEKLAAMLRVKVSRGEMRKLEARIQQLEAQKLTPVPAQPASF